MTFSWADLDALVGGLPSSAYMGYIDALSDDARALSPAELLNTNGVGLRTPGLHSWWADKAGADDLSSGIGRDVRAWSHLRGARWCDPNPKRSQVQNTLWGRIRSMHLGARHEFSTFRLSLGSTLVSARGEQGINESDLTEWMHQHLRVVAIAFEDADALGEL